MGKRNLFKLMAIVALISFMSTTQAQTVTVTGKYLYHNDSQSPLGGITVTLLNQTNQIVATTVTNTDGTYSFTNVPNGDYSIKASTDKPSLGYTMQDCFKVLMHLSGYMPLNSIQFLAADVDKNNLVDKKDLNLMLASWSKKSASFPAGDWEFETSHFTVRSMKSGSVDNLAGPDIPIPPSSGTSTGDLGSVYVPGMKTISTINSDYVNTNYTFNSSVELPVKITSAVPATGFGFSINCPSNFKISEVIPSIQGLNISITGQTISANWLDPKLGTMALDNKTTLFTIKGKATDANESAFTLVGNSHLISKSGEIVYSANIDLPKLSLQNSESFAFALKGNFPNPFAGSTKIVYTLPAAGTVEMKIYNIQGQLVATPVNGFQEAGLKELPFSGNQLQSGVYFCTISLKGDKNYSATSRMVLAR